MKILTFTAMTECQDLELAKVYLIEADWNETEAANRYLNQKSIQAGIKNDPRNYENLIHQQQTTSNDFYDYNEASSM